MSAEQSSNFGQIDPEFEDDLKAYITPRTRSKARDKRSTEQHADGNDGSQKAAAGGEARQSSSKSGTSRHQPARTRPGRPPSAAPKTPAALVLWVPESVRHRMQRHRTDTGTHYLHQVLDALEQTVDELPALVTAANQKRVVKGKLFEREAPTPPPSEARKQLTIRGITTSQLEIIDDLIESTAAGSRSRLITLALDHTLPS